MSEFPGRFPHEPESGLAADLKPKSEKDSKSKKDKSKSRGGSNSPKLPEIGHQSKPQPAERVQNFGKLFVEQSPSATSESPRGQKKKEGRPREEPKAEEHPTTPADEFTPAAERSEERRKDEPELTGKSDAAEHDPHVRHKNETETSGEAERSEGDVARWSAENLLPLDAAYGAAEVIIYDAKPNTEKAHDDTAARIEPAEESGVSSETESEPVLLSVVPHSGQPEEYSAARVHETPPPSEAPVPAAGAAGGGGEKPPSGGMPGAESDIPPDRPFEQAPDPLMVSVAETGRPEPAEAYRQYMEREAVQQHSVGSGNTLPSEPMVTKREAEDDAYYAAKAAQSRGFVTGLLVAGLWARHRGKKLRRQFNQRFKKQEKQLQQVREDQHFYYTEQTKQQANHERQLTAAQDRFEHTEKRLEAHDRQIGSSDRYPETSRPSEDETSPDRLLIPAEHTLQTSAWLTTEIDKLTGLPVEQPAFTYGHEYYRERAQEATPTAQRNAAAGEIALVAAAAASLQAAPGNDNAQSGGTDSSSAHIPLATTQGPPPSAARQKAGSARDPLGRSTSAGPIWPYLLALVVIFVCLAFLLF